MFFDGKFHHSNCDTRIWLFEGMHRQTLTTLP